MAESRRSSTTQLAELNATLLAQNEQLTGAARIAQEAMQTQNGIQGELFRQRGVIAGNIDKVSLPLYRPNRLNPKWPKQTKRLMRCEGEIFV